MKGYRTAHIPVFAKNGTWGDAATGRKLVSDDALNGIVRYTSQQMDYIHQRLKNKLYSCTIQTEEDCFVFNVWSAQQINKHGLIWSKVYTAIFKPFSTLIDQTGEQHISYWLGPPGMALINQKVLLRNADAPSVQQQFRVLWKCNEPEVELPEDPLSLLAEWKDGILEAKIRDIRDKGKRIKRGSFGVEIEFTGVSRDTAARTVAKCLNTAKHYEGGCYHKHLMVDSANRTWQIMRDASIDPSDSSNRQNRDLDNYKCELVTPILCYDDIPLLREIVDALRNRGAVTNGSCGIHVHVDVKGYTALDLKNLVNICCAKEHLLKRALNVLPERDRWCKDADEAFVLALNQNKKELTMRTIQTFWYGGNENHALSASHWHYDQSRYHLLNLHSLWQQHGVEFRCFNSSLDKDQLQTNIVLALAICEQAKSQKKATFKKVSGTSGDKAQMFAWMQQMGLNGDEYKMVRQCLTKHLKVINVRAA